MGNAPVHVSLLARGQRSYMVNETMKLSEWLNFQVDWQLLALSRNIIPIVLMRDSEQACLGLVT